MTINLKDVGSGYKRSAINSNFQAIEDEINDNLLSKNGGVGLEDDLDANSQRVINLADGVQGKDAVNLSQLNAVISAASTGIIASQTEVQQGSEAVSRVFTFSGLAYSPGGNNLYVFRNGQKLGKSEDYEELTTGSIRLTFDPNPVDRFEFVTNVSTTNGLSTTSGNVTHARGGLSHDLSTYLNQRAASVKDYGAVGDGVTDDTDSIKAAVAALNAAGGGALIFPDGGDYFIGQTGAPNAVNIEFVDCSGLKLSFEGGSKISLKADFEHSSSETSSNIIFRRCNNVIIENIETNGNVSTGTKTGAEQGEHGLQFFGCKDVTLINPKLHDHPNDGLYIDHEYTGSTITTASERFTINNLDSYNNGRQGCSIIGVFGCTFSNPKFRDTGKTGSFGSYSPGAGLDIEPNVTGVLTASNIILHNPIFSGNIGACFVTGGEATATFNGRVDNVWLHNPQFIPDSTTTNTDQVIISVMNGGILGGFSDFTGATGVANPRITPIYSDYHCAPVIEDHQIKGPRQCFLAVKDITKTREEQKVFIRRCRFISTDDSAYGDYRPHIEAGGCFEDNYIFIPAAAYSLGPATRKFVVLNDLHSVARNTYETDLAAASSQFAVDYTDSDLVTNEVFLDSTKFFGENTAYQAPDPSLFGDGQMSSRQVTLWDLRGTASGNLQTRQMASYAVPTSGTWNRGDVVWNTQPSAGNNIGWVCIAAGTPGTWKTFGTIAL